MPTAHLRTDRLEMTVPLASTWMTLGSRPPMSTTVISRFAVCQAPRAWQRVSATAWLATGAQEAAKPVTQTAASCAAGTCASCRALPVASWKQSWK